MLFQNCLFDGATSSQGGVNIEIGREGAYDGSPIGVAPYALTFENCSSQSAQEAVFADYTSTLVWRHGYFENLQRAVRLTTQCYAAQIVGNSFANASSDGLGGGYAVKVEGGSRATVKDNYVHGTMDNFIVVDRGNPNTYVDSDSSNVRPDSFSYEMPFGGSSTSQLAANTILELGASKTAIVGGSTTITTFRTQAYTGSQVVIKAHASSLTFGSGGNLTLPGTSYTLASGKFATFVRFDLGADWALVSVSP